MTIKVLNPGLSTTVQDLGRPGYFHLGIPIGGAMDRLALRAGNLLVGNDEGAAGLEAVFVGPQLEFTKDALIAVTGAEMPIKIDGEEQPSWTALKVRAGQVLTFGFLKTGARIYIAIAGGIDVPVALGSRSTYPIGALGGYKGRAIAKDDELPVGVALGSKEGRQLPDVLRRRPGKPAELRVLPGLYWHRVTEASQQAFFDDELEGRAGSRPHGLPFSRRPAAEIRRASAALRGWLRSVQHRRQLLPLWIDPGAGRHRANHPAPRCGFGRRLLHGRCGHFGRHGPDRPVAAATRRPVS